VQLGFVIDHSRCIGCHACTVACKSENDVPVGTFRTWVKYTEEGQFPEVKRSFAVLRCNQCTSAPCVSICPVGALDKRSRDGIVDVDPDACIGCKACMQGCPYDALYINPRKGTAEKCHFCAHRAEQGLAPACAVVCPTEAIIPGDFHDPESTVSRLRRQFDLKARKTEAETGPNVFYRDVADAGIQPLTTNSAGGYIWSDRRPGPQLEAAEFEALEKKARARTVYDVAHPPLWGGKITGYLFAKSLAAGVFLASGFAGLAPFDFGGGDAGASAWKAVLLPLLALVFLGVTGFLLVADLKRPERFFYILTRPNWSSWLVRGTWAIIAYSGMLLAWCAAPFTDAVTGMAHHVLYGCTVVAASLVAAYTGWLFGQAKGRVLWMRRGLWAHLIVQAVVAGSAVLVLAAPLLGLEGELSSLLGKWLGLHGAFVLLEGRLAPRKRREEYRRAHDLVAEGPWAARHWRFGVLLGILAPLLLLAIPGLEALAPLAAVLALYGLWVEEDVLVRAGQALPIS